MKYLLLMHVTKHDWENPPQRWAAEDTKRLVAYMDELNQELTDRGELVAAHGLAGPTEMKTVQVRSDEELLITDGPFPESKEVLIGYWMVDVATVERAIEIAERASVAPGPGGAPVYQPIEVHPLGTPPA